MTELVYSVQIAYSRTFRRRHLVVMVTTVLTVVQFYVERHFARGAAGGVPPTPFQRLRRALLPTHVIPELPAGRGR